MQATVDAPHSRIAASSSIICVHASHTAIRRYSSCRSSARARQHVHDSRRARDRRHSSSRASRCTSMRRPMRYRTSASCSGDEPLTGDFMLHGKDLNFYGYGALQSARDTSRMAAVVHADPGGVLDVAPLWFDTSAAGSMRGIRSIARTIRAAFGSTRTTCVAHAATHVVLRRRVADDAAPRRHDRRCGDSRRRARAASTRSSRATCICTQPRSPACAWIACTRISPARSPTRPSIRSTRAARGARCTARARFRSTRSPCTGTTPERSRACVHSSTKRRQAAQSTARAALAIGLARHHRASRRSASAQRDDSWAADLASDRNARDSRRSASGQERACDDRERRGRCCGTLRSRHRAGRDASRCQAIARAGTSARCRYRGRERNARARRAAADIQRRRCRCQWTRAALRCCRKQSRRAARRWRTTQPHGRRHGQCLRASPRGFAGAHARGRRPTM